MRKGAKGKRSKYSIRTEDGYAVSISSLHQWGVNASQDRNRRREEGVTLPYTLINLSLDDDIRINTQRELELWNSSIVQTWLFLYVIGLSLSHHTRERRSDIIQGRSKGLNSRHISQLNNVLPDLRLVTMWSQRVRYLQWKRQVPSVKNKPNTTTHLRSPVE